VRRTLFTPQGTTTTDGSDQTVVAQGDESTWVDELASQQEEPVPF
jgi:hypothetical protein